MQSLREERDRLRAEIETNRLQLELIEKLLASSSEKEGVSRRATKPTKRTNGHARPESKESIRTAAIVDLLRERGEVHRSVIFDHLQTLGIGPNSMLQLAPLLSAHKELFLSNGRGNFRLAESESNGGA
jgi:hypothetical protein